MNTSRRDTQSSQTKENTKMATWKLVLIFGDDNNSTNGATEEVTFQADEQDADVVAKEMFDTTDADDFYIDFISE